MEFASFVLAASTADLAEEPRARADADAVEFRMDLAAAAAGTADPLEQLAAYDGDLPVLATNRVRDEGGRAAAGPARLDALVAAVEQPAVEAVDVELATVEAGDGAGVVDAAREHDVAVVVSAHEFEATPALEAMVGTLDAAAAAGDVGKLSVAVADPGDTLAVLEATWTLAERGVPVATTAMGEAGRHARAVAPVYGSRIGFAPVDPARATAPGQYDLATLRRLVDGLQSRGAGAGPPAAGDGR